MVKKYTKGERDTVVSRVEQVSCITLNVPLTERCMDYLYDGLMELSHHYIDENNGDSFLNIPAIDFYNIALFANKCCKEKNIDTKYISSLYRIISTFANLKYVNVIFNDDTKLRDSYERLLKAETEGILNDAFNELVNIYSIDLLDIYLGDMFDQNIIDLINKSFISNNIISNSYLERDFVISFEFDEYISYINMFVDNNIDILSMMDKDILDYLRVFPSIIGDISKPDINLYTNYKEV
jgi:hypothetical protein